MSASTTSSQLLCWSGSQASGLPTNHEHTSITLVAKSKMPLLHTTSSPYKDGPLPSDWLELQSSSDARAFATVPLMHGREARGAVLLAAPLVSSSPSPSGGGGRDASGTGSSVLAGLDAPALAAIGLALSLYCVAESADSVTWLASTLWSLLDSTSLQQMLAELCTGVSDFIGNRFMMAAGVQACILAEPESGIAAMVHGSTTVPSMSEAGGPPSLQSPSSAPGSGRGGVSRSYSRRAQMSGVRRILAETGGSESQSGAKPPISATRANRSASGLSAMAAANAVAAANASCTDGEEVDAPMRAISQQSAAFCMPEQRVLRARTFKMAATMFQQLVEDSGAPRGMVLDDCARHVQDVHKPTRDISMLIQSAAARSLVLTGITLSNGATLGVYVCFSARMPLRLLNAMHVATYELLQEALRPCLDNKICGELSHEFDILKAGVPGIYLATTTQGPAQTSGAHAHIGGAHGLSCSGLAQRAASTSNAPSRRVSQPQLSGRSMKSPLSAARNERPNSASLGGMFNGAFATTPGQMFGAEDGAPVSNSGAPSTGNGPRMLVTQVSGRGGAFAPGTLAAVARLDVDDALLASGYDSGTVLNNALMESLNNVQLTFNSPHAGGGSQAGNPPLPMRASSLIRVQEVDGSTAIRNQMGVLVSSFQASLQDTHLERLMEGRNSVSNDDLDQLQLVSLLGRGGNGIVLRGLLAQVAVAVKLIGMPDPEPSTPPATGRRPNSITGPNSPSHRALQRAKSQTRHAPGSGRDSPTTVATAHNGNGTGNGNGAMVGNGNVGAPDDGAPDLSPSEQLSRRRELARGAMELAVLSTTSHPCLVQVFSYYTNVVLEESGAGPSGEETYSLRRFSPAEDLQQRPGATPPMIFTAVCMEWCDQGSLHDAIGTGRLHRIVEGGGSSTYVIDMEAIYLTLLEVAMALRYLHARRIVHRDVKPGNVLLKSAAAPAAADGDTRGYNAKLADFGFALQMDQVEGDRAFVIPDQACGSVPYMAPETFRSGSKLDGAVDIYSMGIVMWEAVSGGEQPYTGVPNKDIPREVYRGRRPAFRPEVPYAYRSLAQACWAAQPSKRPTATQLVSALKYNLQVLTQQRNQ
ncbi:hypothetical protein HYH03_003758 [Edaphochlamys debaryana]|uniref:Protein kinase domain-containing protein n=1 Tax=Edaphochlamys debaryana TaxID=47281 RepID=A0A836C481_9CHLO|nr:hypothetical protein HYH03_003758 [Edaphochlamys debaryana]|eukprot:KAG2498507.1 hypothetical protein HYH03_003758 [Edaphochlamys debaryana]